MSDLNTDTSSPTQVPSARFTDYPIQGGCPCRALRYSMKRNPLFTHCCHCTYCQRESASAFCINAMIEMSQIEILSGTIKLVPFPSISGTDQLIARCDKCDGQVWGYYGGMKDVMCSLRIGTLDTPNVLGEPDMHIYTSTKLGWVDLSNAKVPVMEDWYDRNEYWPKESLDRMNVLREKFKNLIIQASGTGSETTT